MNAQYKDWVNGGTPFLRLYTPRLACGHWAGEPPRLDLQEASGLQSWAGGHAVRGAASAQAVGFRIPAPPPAVWVTSPSAVSLSIQ